MSGPLATRQKTVLIGLETNRGEAVVPAVVVLALNPKIDNATEYLEREFAGATGGLLPGSHGPRIGTFSCQVEFRGNGSSGSPDLDPGLKALLLACGMQAASGPIYKPQSSIADQQTATIYVNEAGVLRALSGCAGTWKLDADSGNLALFTFDLRGVWVDPTDVAIVGLTHSTVVPPRFASASLAIGALNPKIGRLSIDLGGDVQMREDQNTAAACSEYYVAGRKPSVGLDPEKTLVITHDWMGLWKSGATAVFAATLGQAAGNRAVIGCPALQYRLLADGDRGGKQIYQLTGQPCVVTGDDDLTITPS